MSGSWGVRAVGNGVGVWDISKGLLDTRWVSRRADTWDDLLYSVIAVAGGVYPLGSLSLRGWRGGLGLNSVTWVLEKNDEWESVE